MLKLKQIFELRWHYTPWQILTNPAFLPKKQPHTGNNSHTYHRGREPNYPTETSVPQDKRATTCHEMRYILAVPPLLPQTMYRRPEPPKSERSNRTPRPHNTHNSRHQRAITPREKCKNSHKFIKGRSTTLNLE